MSSRVLRWSLAATSFAVVALALAPVARAAGRWRIEPAAIPTGTNPSTLVRGVSCPSRTACFAVGGFSTDESAGERPLVERWDGHAWTIQAAPEPDGGSDGTLLAVSCASPTACEAVGWGFFGPDIRPFGEHWDGTSWSARSVPFPAGEQGSLDGITCVSATDCVAVGEERNSAGKNAFVVRWDGTSWTVQDDASPPGVSMLHAVSCSAADACTAVGDAGDTIGSSATTTFGERWDGTTWTPQATANPAGVSWSELLGASCPSATSCTAVGYHSNRVQSDNPILVEHWDGRTWSLQPTPSAASNGMLSAVSCASANACTAVGSDNSLLAESWDGSTWTLQRPPLPDGAERVDLYAVSCPAATECVAAGAYNDSSFHELPLIERYHAGGGA